LTGAAVDLPDWDLALGSPFVAGNASWVAPATCADGTHAVLKLGVPHREAEHEADALALWAGDGAVRLLRHDRARWALLLERCEPGDPLWSLPDERAANEIAAGVLARLWRPAPSDGPFHALADEGRRWALELPGHWERHGRPVPRSLIDEAAALATDLAASQPELVLCHQDLHGGNVLRAGAGWLAIDPKPLIGERAFDVASLVRDRRPQLLAGPDPARVLRGRLDQLCERLGLDRERARGWAIVHALAWGLGDAAPEPDIVRCAELLAQT
jgi:streptomycin 6-kinase